MTSHCLLVVFAVVSIYVTGKLAAAAELIGCQGNKFLKALIMRILSVRLTLSELKRRGDRNRPQEHRFVHRLSFFCALTFSTSVFSRHPILYTVHPELLFPLWTFGSRPFSGAPVRVNLTQKNTLYIRLLYEAFWLLECRFSAAEILSHEHTSSGNNTTMDSRCFCDRYWNSGAQRETASSAEKFAFLISEQINIDIAGYIQYIYRVAQKSKPLPNYQKIVLSQWDNIYSSN